MTHFFVVTCYADATSSLSLDAVVRGLPGGAAGDGRRRVAAAGLAADARAAHAIVVCEAARQPPGAAAAARLLSVRGASCGRSLPRPAPRLQTCRRSSTD